MLKGIDHLVIVVADLEQAVYGYRSLGFTVVAGGRHTVGTHNALIAFEDGSYLELIAFFEPRSDHRWWDPHQKGGGFIDACLQTDDLGADTLALRRAGVKIGDPEPKSRIRPDGYEVRWLYSLPLDEHRGVAPFIIQDVTPRRERVPSQTRHENGVLGIQRLVVAVSKPQTVGEWYRGLPGVEGVEAIVEEPDGAGLRFRVGPHEIALLSPTDSRSPLGSWISKRGASPYSAALTASDAVGWLDESKSFGAKLLLTRPRPRATSLGSSRPLGTAST